MKLVHAAHAGFFSGEPKRKELQRSQVSSHFVQSKVN